MILPKELAVASHNSIFHILYLVFRTEGLVEQANSI